MRVSVTVVDPRQDARRDVLIDAADETPMAEVLAELQREALGVVTVPGVPSLAARRAADAGESPLYLDGHVLDTGGTLADSGLREGSLVVVGDAAASLRDEPSGTVELRLVSGRGAGAVHRLDVGEATIGGDPACVVCLPDDRVPPVAVTVSVAADGTVTISPYDDAAAALAAAFPNHDHALALDREALTQDTTWPVGGLLQLGDFLVELEQVDEPDAAVAESPDPGWLDYNRPPRLLPPLRQTAFKLPSPPSEQTRLGLPWLVMLMPMALAIVFVLVTGRLYMLMMGLFSPVMMLGNYLQNRKQGKMSYRQQLADYKDKKRRIEEDAEQAVVDERLARRLDAPDPAMVLLVANGPRSRLWERRTTDPDYLAVRLGVGDLESEVTVEDPEQLEHRRRTVRTAYDVPVTIPLSERGVVGIAGRGDLPRRIAAWAVVQLAVLQSPRDTVIYVLTDQDGAADWDWLRWLPHARPSFGQDTVTTIGVDAESCGRRIAELTAVLSARRQARGARSGAPVAGPDVVVVVDGARRLRSLPGVVTLLKEGPPLGIYALCLDSDERLLPEEATAVVVETVSGLALRQQRITVVEDVTPDLVEQPWLQRVARALAPVRDISGGDDDAILPSACRLTEVMQLEPVGAQTIMARWAVQPRSTEAVIGISLDGPFAIDLRRDGPHGLVAGTTGAGKSELLQIAGRVPRGGQPPDGMTFVLVDYKGGAAFKDCENLPHTVGMVTDLDAHLVERALVSLGAELTRREHLLADAGAKDIEDYVDLRENRPQLDPMPRLLIVIDEFASLARELPDFVTGLVNIAQRGRSLGIHLILATQRPGGVVSPEIRANTNLRIALRVTDASESTDVIDAPDAGSISKANPGRAYVRLGRQLPGAVPVRPGRRPPSRRDRRSAPAPVAATAAAGRPRSAHPDAAADRDQGRRRGHRPHRARRCRPRGQRGARARSPAQPVAAGADHRGPAVRPARGPRPRRVARRAPSGHADPRAVRRGGPAPAAGPSRGGPRLLDVLPPLDRRRTAQRTLPGAADHGRLPRAGQLPRRRAPLRPRLRQRRPPAAGRPAALRCRRATHPARPGHPAAHPVDGRARAPPGGAGVRGLRRPGRAARAGGPRGPSAPRRAHARPLGGLPRLAGRARRRRTPRPDPDAAARGRVGGHPPRPDR